jgi:hypothetical protein
MKLTLTLKRNSGACLVFNTLHYLRLDVIIVFQLKHEEKYVCIKEYEIISELGNFMSAGIT